MFITIFVVVFTLIDLIALWVAIRHFMPIIKVLRSKDQTIVQATNEIVGSQLRGTWNGEPETLQANLDALVPRVQDLLRAQGVEPSPMVVRALLTKSIREHALAPHDLVRKALARLS